MKFNKLMMATLFIGAVALASCTKKDTDVIQLKVTEAEVAVGATYQIEVTKASGAITWSSADVNIATVSEQGVVFGASEGKTVVTATVGKASANVQVTVTDGGIIDLFPTLDDLMNDYDVETGVVLCVHFESEICNDVVIAGSYNGWSIDDPASMIHMEELAAFPGWYVAEIPFEEGLQAKPMQLKSDGTATWDFQTGDPASWEYVAGNEMTIEAGYDGEANVSYPAAGAYIYVSKYFKNHKSPCVAAVKHDYTVTLVAPIANCENEPAIIGDFNGWAASQEMTLNIDGTYSYTFNDEEGHAFKFRALTDTDWTNQIQLYIDSTDTWYDNPNITLGAETNIRLDYSAGTYTACRENTTPEE